MSTRITRAGKASALTHNEMDTNLKKASQTKAGAYTVAESDNWDTIEYSGTGAEAFTLPDAATVVAAADTGDFEVTVKHVGTGTLTIDRTTGADTIDGTAADITLETNEAKTLKVNQAGDGYISVAYSHGGTIVADLTGDVTGNADTATTWETTRTIDVSGDISSDSVNIDGSGNITITGMSIGSGRVGQDEITLGGVRFNNEIDLGTDTVSTSLSTTFVVPRGVYYAGFTVLSTRTIDLELQVNSVWVIAKSVTGLNPFAAIIVSDGTNARINLASGSAQTITLDEIFN